MSLYKVEADFSYSGNLKNDDSDAGWSSQQKDGFPFDLSFCWSI